MQQTFHDCPIVTPGILANGRNATGGENVRPKDSAVTRSTTGKGKIIHYRQLHQGNYDETR